jgi:hypothetical protein
MISKKIAYIIMEDYIGRYYVFKTRTKVDAREYILNIIDLSGDTANFSLELVISGNFGSVGKTWEGECFLKEDKLILQCKKLNDWQYTFLDEEKDEQVSETATIFRGTLSKEGNNIRLDITFEVNKIFLYKMDRDDSNISYRISRKIIEQRDLEEKVWAFDPHRFWCISNLVYMDIKDRDLGDLEIVCEYDLEFRLEEKRVINADEIISAHHLDRIVLDSKYKIKNYTFLT